MTSETRRYTARLNWDGFCLSQRPMQVRLTQDVPGGCRLAIRHEDDTRFRTPQGYRGKRILGTIAEVWSMLERLDCFGPRLDT